MMDRKIRVSWCLLVMGALILGSMLGMTCKKKNQPPCAPSIPLGPVRGRMRDTLRFSTVAEDPNGDSVSVRFDWGDGTKPDWSKLVRSGDSVVMTHAWQRLGSYSIRAQARDAQDTVSIWSGEDQLTITSFSMAFGGTSQDFGNSVQQTADGGYIVTGSTWSYGAGGCDVCLIKTDTSGNQVWFKTFGGSGYDWGNSVQQTTDGGYIITGGTNSYGAGWWDVYLIKTDSSGNQVWFKTFGGIGYDEGCSVQQTTDAGYVITGYWYSEGSMSTDAFLIKTDASGNQVWAKTFGWPDATYGRSVQRTTDGGYIIAGSRNFYSECYSDVCLIKTDASGNQVWYKAFGGSGADEGFSVQQTADGGYIVSGTTDSCGAGDFNVYLIKSDSSGNEVWFKTLGGSGGDSGNSVQQTTDGGYIIAGGTNSYGAGGSDVFLIRTDADGN